jgi:outer membrane protein assembly factor BamE (lipoprotein component of BamABCDE complex)
MWSRNHPRTWVLVVGALLLCACVETGTKIDPAKVDAFEVGKTTIDQAVTALGEPSARTLHGEETFLYWSHVSSQAQARAFIPFANLSGNNVASQSESVTLVFRKGVLIDKTASQTATKAD